jgi:periplasmic protein TonB
MSAKPSAKVVPIARRAKRRHQVTRKSVLNELDARVAQLEAIVAKLDQRMTRRGFHRPFQVSLAASVLLHLLVIGLVTFNLPDKGKASNDKPLEVVLVNAKSKAKPVKAQALAQHNLDGGGNTDADRRAKSPMPLLRNDPQSREVAMAQRRVEQLEQEVRRQLLTQQKSRVQTATAPPQPVPQETPQVQVPPAPTITKDDIERSLQIQRMEAEISKMWDAYQKRPRRYSVGASTAEYRFARYIEDWRVKVMRIAEHNYPQAASDKKIYGSLLLTVSIKANGTIENIELRRSSGHKVLDDAAMRIVRMGAPYAAFPPDIARDTDVIDISRTWRFTSSDRIETD